MNKQIKIKELENLLFKAIRSLRNGDEIVINNCTTCVPFPFKIVAYKNDEGRTTFLVTTNYGDPNCKAMDEGGSSGFHIRDLIQDVFNPDESEMEEIDNCGIWVDDSELAPLALLESKKLEEKSSYNALQDILKDDTLSSTAYTETNEGIEITFSIEELEAVTGMKGAEAIKYLFHCYGCDEEFTELANEEEFITIEFPYKHKNLTESEETEEEGFVRDFVDELVADGLTDEIYEQVTEGKNYSDYQLELVDDVIRYFIDDWRNDSGDIEAETAEEAKQIILNSIDDYLEPNLPDDEDDEEADRGYLIKKSEIERLMDLMGMTYEEAEDYFSKRSEIERLMGLMGMTYEEAIRRLRYDPSLTYVPTLEGVGWWAKLRNEQMNKMHQKEGITNVARKDLKRIFEGSVKNKNLKNKKLREAITKKAKEKLNLLNDIVNFAYEYGEDATKGLFQQAFKKVTGDDLIDALDDDK